MAGDREIDPKKRYETCMAEVDRLMGAQEVARDDFVKALYEVGESIATCLAMICLSLDVVRDDLEAIRMEIPE